MPYIKQEYRDIINAHIDGMQYDIGSDVGKLNYAITELCRRLLANTESRYADYNSVVGVLESAKLEFYRRAVAWYEDGKVIENGDVY